MDTPRDMGTLARISSVLTKILAIWLAAHTFVAAQDVSPQRPSLRLVFAGVAYTTPSQWTAEDLPQLNSVMLLGPAQVGSPWRPRILLELVSLKKDKDLANQVEAPELSKQGIGKVKKIMQRRLSQISDGHGKEISAPTFELSTERSQHQLHETRILVATREEGTGLLITASYLTSQNQSDFDTLLKGLTVRRD